MTAQVRNAARRGRPRDFLALALVLGLCLACHSLPTEPPPPPWAPFESAELGAAENVHRAGSLWISGMPPRAELELVERRGLRLLIDARRPVATEPYDFAAAAAAHGLDYARIPLDPSAPDPRLVERALEELRRPGGKLLFCDDGGGAALLFAAHRIRDGALPVELALVEARRLGMKPGVAEEFIRSLGTPAE